MQPKMTTYVNRGDLPAEVVIGTHPGAAPTVYRCEPGGTVQGPTGYVEAFARSGLVPAPEGVEAAPAAAPKKAAPAPVADVVADVPAAVTITSAPAPVAASVEAPATEPKAAPVAKGKGK